MTVEQLIQEDIVYVPYQIRRDVYQCPKCSCLMRVEQNYQEILEIKKHYEGLIRSIQESYK